MWIYLESYLHNVVFSKTGNYKKNSKWYLSKLHVKKIKYFIRILPSSSSLVALLDAADEHGLVEQRSQSVVFMPNSTINLKILDMWQDPIF